MTNTTRTVLTWLVTIFLALISPLPILADDDDVTFVLRVRPGAIQRVVSQFDLEVEERIAGQQVYLVERDDDDDEDDDDDDDSLATFLAAVRAHPDVLSFPSVPT